MTHPAALARVRGEDPSLAFKADQEIQGVAAAFANDYTPDNTAKNKATAETAVQTRARRIRNTDIAAAGWLKVDKLQRTASISRDEAFEQIKREDTEFANCFEPVHMFNAASASGSSDGKMSPAGVEYADPAARQKAAQAAGARQSNENGVAQADIVRLHLPFDCSQEEFAAADSGGGNPQKMFDNLVQATMRSQNMSQDSARAFALGRYQKLARLASVPGATLNSSQGKSFDAAKM
jgi:hypothetical protein